MNVIPYLKSKYKPMGYNYESGFDCWGLVWHIFKFERGVDLPMFLSIPRNEKGIITSLFTSSANDCQVGEHKVVEGEENLAFVTMGKNEKVTHVGVLIIDESNQKKVIHASEDSGIIITPIKELKKIFSHLKTWKLQES